MTKKTKEQKTVPPTSNAILSDFLRRNSDDHYNDEEAVDYTISTGSLYLDMKLEGGFGPGLHRFLGPDEGGKTSEALTVAKNFLDSTDTPKPTKALYVCAEGRLSRSIKDRSGLKFVYDPKDWKVGTCFVFFCNIYETVADLIRQLVFYTEEDVLYCIIVDSIDGLIPKNDIGKSFEDSVKVAGGAVIASVLMKQIAIALTNRGHMAIFTSQVRSSIRLDNNSNTPIRQTTATGGNALLHYSNITLEYQMRFSGDRILLNPNEKYPHPEKNPIIGHWAKVTVKKSANEKTNLTFSYPIKYGRTGGRSIWVEKEIIDMLLLWELLHRKGSWYSFSEDLLEIFRENNIVCDKPKWQGEAAVFSFLEKNDEIRTFLISYFKNLVREI